MKELLEAGVHFGHRRMVVTKKLAKKALSFNWRN
jgi:ribosomal protein S2